MKQYHDVLRHIIETGVDKTDRTGVGTRSNFGYQMRFNLADGFPLLTTKKVHWKSVVHELIWLISGSTNIKYLKDNGITIWDEWADTNGELGPVYGKQWRRWEAIDREGDPWAINSYHIDQLADVIQRIKDKPNDRRLIVTAWNPADVPKQALPPCHAFFQFYVANGKLSLQMYQRSCDMFLGVPFNIASYALLLTMVAQVTGLQPGEFVHTLGDAHVYLNHFEQVKELLSREPMPLPKLYLDTSVKNIDDFRFEHVLLSGYNPHAAIKAPVAV